MRKMAPLVKMRQKIQKFESKVYLVTAFSIGTTSEYSIVLKERIEDARIKAKNSNKKGVLVLSGTQCGLAATINNCDIIQDSNAIKKMIGYLPESNPLYNDMMVYDLLEFTANIRNIFGEEFK